MNYLLARLYPKLITWISCIGKTPVQQGKSKKAKVKRKNADFVRCLAILNGWLISAVLYYFFGKNFFHKLMCS